MYQPIAMSGTYLDPDLNNLYKNFMTVRGHSPVVLWLRLYFNAEGPGFKPQSGN